MEGIKAINELFDKRIKHQRIKKYGEQSKIRRAIREEPVKLAQYLRGEKEGYEPISSTLLKTKSQICMVEVTPC